MIVDSSALLAVLFREPDAGRYERALGAAPACRMSLANVLESSIVWEGRVGATAGQRFDLFMEQVGIEHVAVTAEHVAEARQAWRRYGKGNHPAALNFGDCFAYALAAVTGEPLLFKGEDFALTDIEAA
ncbi:MAG: type II toxin-antitoxin system VapC family toxin [Rhodospirillales bacterium]|nr:type II toxin-antitoxin system VapC family toxin [Rhodospirillales bacterium]MDE0379254.1 type II toxin-antitoxin system VapC family toxin [Rhodospirillales bacterium]MDE0392059.1 type II toxin-antitoxin system VapC family toxin [Rhodospirillales bacterium]